MTGINYGICQEILAENLNMHFAAVKFIPSPAHDEPTFLLRIIMRNENWIYGYDLETKQLLLQWKNQQYWRVFSKNSSELFLKFGTDAGITIHFQGNYFEVGSDQI